MLELASGPGGVGLAAAERVAPGGEVVLSDIAPEMTAIARRRAEARGLTNVQARELDLEQIDEPDASYDVVLCREGIMLVPDPARAAREIARVLRPGGRVGLAVGGRGARTHGSGSSSTRSALSSARRCRPRVFPGRSHSAIPTGSQGCSPARGSPT